jgi:hypothetical protein
VHEPACDILDGYWATHEPALAQLVLLLTEPS